MLRINNFKRSYATFSNQARLPRLPIPALESTQERYKRSLLPLLSQADYERVSTTIDHFFKSELSSTLQKRLQDLDADNWLDQLWLKKAYLEYRIPTLINVNWWNQFQDFGLIPAEQSRSSAFCMHQLKNMFGTSRIAASGVDRVVTQWPCLAKHVNVIYKDQIFSVDVIGPQGETVSVKQLEQQLRWVVEQVDNHPKQPPIGLLTTEHRDTWGPIREELETQTINAKSLENIDRSLFVFCLDDYSSSDDLSHRNMFHARNGRNRWFDKALQFIVENNGRAGINGEHSPADAVIPSRILDDALASEPMQTEAPTVNLAAPTRLNWDLSNRVQEAIKTAEINASKLIQDLDSVLLVYDGYGADEMKKAKVSPDGWLQMAFQLAYYRQYGQPCPTYESASTRKFLKGRTETVRSCSVESVAFTKAWDDKDIKASH
ncbi:hypothetical protein CU098_008099 [Rhizopus stolonifer]|uniref:Choline/carnitine acyltransferase domain-containing protein n=1 Tax=Rhizopus stolonifer TaxID=4846 RepID=A0A367KVL2_RHIST|nr:hypothetical protein CU098_008099 [Rhizopus stolonifer]